MYCGNCGTKLPEGSAFCPNCGAAQGKTGGKRTGETSKKGLIAAIVILALLAAALGGVLLGSSLSAKAPKGNKEPAPGGPSPVVSIQPSAPGITPSPSAGNSSATQPPQSANTPVTPPPGDAPGTNPAAPSNPTPPANPVQPGDPAVTADPNTPPDPAVTTSPTAPTDTDQPLYVSGRTVYENGGFRVEYPLFGGRNSEIVNKIVFDRVRSLGFEGDSTIEQYTGSHRGEVTLLNDSILSMVFWGSGYVEGAAHDYRQLTPLNLDLKTMKPFRLSDIYRMRNENFVSVVYAFGYGPDWPDTMEASDAYYDLFDYERDTFQGLINADDGFLLPLGPVFTTYIGITGVEHLEILVRYEELTDYYIGPYSMEELSTSR